MSSLRIARRYATALLSLSTELNKIEEVEQDLATIEATANSSADLRLMFRSPIIESWHKVKVLQDVFGDSISDLSMDFFVLITEKRRDVYWKEIISEFRVLLDTQRSVQRVHVTSASDVDAALRTQLENALAKRTGKKIIATYSSNAELLGGTQIRMGDQVLDGSLRHQLGELRKRLADA